jgi:MYXO-CTERM domain-containing protein
MIIQRFTVIAVLLAAATPALAQNTVSPVPANNAPATVAPSADAPLPPADDEATEYHHRHSHHPYVGLLGLLGLLGLAGLRRR